MSKFYRVVWLAAYKKEDGTKGECQVSANVQHSDIMTVFIAASMMVDRRKDLKEVLAIESNMVDHAPLLDKLAMELDGIIADIEPQAKPLDH